MQVEKDPIRILFDQQSEQGATDVITGEIPTAWRGTDIRFELAFSRTVDRVMTLLDISNWASVMLTVKAANDIDGLNLMERGTGTLTPIVAAEDWKDGSDQHCVIEFSATETRLDLGGLTEKKFVLYVNVTTALGNTFTTGFASFRLMSNGQGGPVTPPLGSSLIPAGTNYSGAGTYVLTVVPGQIYSWEKGANDTNLVNGGAAPLTATGQFMAQGATVTLNGTASALITALVRWPMVYTAEQVNAKIDSCLRLINQPGVLIGTVSDVNTDVSSANYGKKFMRLTGVSPEGLPIDEIKDLTAI